jgi:nitroreductase
VTDIFDIIASRRTVHEYRDGALPDGTLERALDAAVAAPNHRMTEPWRFRRVGPNTRAELLAIYLDLKTAATGTLTEGRTTRLRAKFMTPAELLVVSRVRHDDPSVAREDYAAIACAVQNLTLALHADGVGSKWTTGAVTRDSRTYEALGVDFDSERIEGFVWAGIAATGAKPARRLDGAAVLTTLP